MFAENVQARPAAGILAVFPALDKLNVCARHEKLSLLQLSYNRC